MQPCNHATIEDANDALEGHGSSGVQRYEAKVSTVNMAGEGYDAGATSYYSETDALMQW